MTAPVGVAITIAQTNFLQIVNGTTGQLLEETEQGEEEAADG